MENVIEKIVITPRTPLVYGGYDEKTYHQIYLAQMKSNGEPERNEKGALIPDLQKLVYSGGGYNYGEQIILAEEKLRLVIQEPNVDGKGGKVLSLNIEGTEYYAFHDAEYEFLDDSQQDGAYFFQLTEGADWYVMRIKKFHYVPEIALSMNGVKCQNELFPGKNKLYEFSTRPSDDPLCGKDKRIKLNVKRKTIKI